MQILLGRKIVLDELKKDTKFDEQEMGRLEGIKDEVCINYQNALNELK